jgi:hypothetical protein
MFDVYETNQILTSILSTLLRIEEAITGKTPESEAAVIDQAWDEVEAAAYMEAPERNTPHLDEALADGRIFTDEEGYYVGEKLIREKVTFGKLGDDDEWLNNHLGRNPNPESW